MPLPRFMRRELVPIEHLGVAADALGKGRDVPDFAFSGGTREGRNAATAFQTMGIRVWDSSAEVRYLVIPERPAGTEDLSEEKLAGLVTRDAMIGVARL